MIKVAVLGATGYTALEAIKILLRHPQAEIVAVTSRQEGNTPVSSVHPSLVGRLDQAARGPHAGGGGKPSRLCIQLPAPLCQRGDHPEGAGGWREGDRL